MKRKFHRPTEDNNITRRFSETEEAKKAYYEMRYGTKKPKNELRCATILASLKCKP